MSHSRKYLLASAFEDTSTALTLAMLTSFKCDPQGLGDKGHARRKDKVSTTSNLISHMQRGMEEKEKEIPLGATPF